MSQDISAKSLEDQFGEDAVTPGGDGAFAVFGHWLYVKKMKRPDEGDIVLSDKSQSSSNVFRVLAKGVRVGKRRTQDTGWGKALRKRHGVPLHLPDSISIGDDLIVAEGAYADKLLRHSIYENDEFFIDESVPIGKVER